jgi:NAD(P)-dependent dehydrogenase (short-subunit alcohol dehydrogenase family)
MSGRFEDRVAVVTGAAGGMGRAAAIRLASEGAAIEIIDLKDSTPVVKEIKALAEKPTRSKAIAPNEDQIGRAVKEIENRHGRVDILVNNAGILSGRKPWHTISKEEMNRYVQVNFRGYFLVT